MRKRVTERRNWLMKRLRRLTEMLRIGAMSRSRQRTSTERYTSTKRQRPCSHTTRISLSSMVKLHRRTHSTPMTMTVSASKRTSMKRIEPMSSITPSERKKIKGSSASITITN